MSTTITEQRHSITAAIAQLLRDRPAFDAPEHVKALWLANKLDLLAAVESVEATR